MKKSTFVIISLLAICLLTPTKKLTAQTATELLVPTEEHQKQAMVISAILSRFHYRSAQFNDSLSSLAFDRYLESLDERKIYFLQEDIDQFETFRQLLDDQVLTGGLEVPFGIFDIYQQRAADRIHFSKYVLQKGFDFTLNESMETGAAKNWPESQEAQNEIWRKLIKNQALSLKLSGKTWPEIVEILEARFERQEKTINKYVAEDVFQVFMNAITETYDPHTSYFSPVASENFKINMNLSLEGIGARLQSVNDYTVVYEITPGGPAFKTKQLHKNDKIIGVAQGKEGEMVDVTGWRLDEVIQLIRGKKDTLVRLLLLRAADGANALPHEISIIREKIKLEDQAVSYEAIPIEYEGTQFNLGLISIPSFYMNFEAYAQGDENFESTTRDVKNALDSLQKQQNLDGLLIDLRYNGGGSLSEAVKLTGLFIENGPVVQIKRADGSLETEEDTDTATWYDGPLAVLVNRYSASASEIFAGAIQDYQRGIVIGEQTYGKGTVQNLIGLEQFLPDEKVKLGELKLTLAKYYRVTGSTTQHLGVKPDVAMPTPVSAEMFGESTEPSALPYDMIAAAGFEKTHAVSAEIIEQLRKKHQERLLLDEQLQKLIASIATFKERLTNNSISLNEAERRKNMDTETDETDGDEDEDHEQADYLKDAYLKESLYLLADLILKKE